jgi:hypothetical protein
MQGHGHVIVNCRIAGAPNGSDVQIYPSSDGVIVAENTIVGALLDGIILGSDGGGTTSNLTLANNVVAFNGRYGISTYWAGTEGTGNVAVKNVVWGTAAGRWWEAASTGSTTRSPTRSSSTSAWRPPPPAGQPRDRHRQAGVRHTRRPRRREPPPRRRPDIGAYER